MPIILSHILPRFLSVPIPIYPFPAFHYCILVMCIIWLYIICVTYCKLIFIFWIVILILLFHMWMHCINLFFLLLHKQKCIQKHYNEFILLELLGSSVCKTVEHIQLLNPKMRTWQIQFKRVIQVTYLKDMIAM